MTDSEQRNFGRRKNDLVLVELTEKIVENNNSVSTVVNLMGENLTELAEAEIRIEDKVDDIYDVMKKIEDSGVLKLAKTVRALIYAIILAIFGAVGVLILKYIVIHI